MPRPESLHGVSRAAHNLRRGKELCQVRPRPRVAKQQEVHERRSAQAARHERQAARKALLLAVGGRDEKAAPESERLRQVAGRPRAQVLRPDQVALSRPGTVGHGASVHDRGKYAPQGQQLEVVRRGRAFALHKKQQDVRRLHRGHSNRQKAGRRSERDDALPGLHVPPGPLGRELRAHVPAAEGRQAVRA